MMLETKQCSSSMTTEQPSSHNEESVIKSKKFRTSEEVNLELGSNLFAFKFS